MEMPQDGSRPATKDGKSTPVWRATFDAFERPIADASESWLQSETFMDGLALVLQLLRFQNGLTYYAGLTRPPIGRSPRDLVWERDQAKLWRYCSARRRIEPPIVIVHSLISKSYILDLLPNNSMVGFLIDQGFDVF